MNQDYEQLQSDYIEALRPVVSDALRWWDAHCPYPHTDLRPFDTMVPFHRRWVAGPAAHPRVLAIFREYFFKVQELNDRALAAAKDTAGEDVSHAGQWGKDVRPAASPRQRPADLLIDDLSSVAPDLFEVMQGLAYVPIGTDPLNGEEC